MQGLFFLAAVVSSRWLPIFSGILFAKTEVDILENRFPTIEKSPGFPYVGFYVCIVGLRHVACRCSVGGRMETQGQGPAWIVFVVWVLVPLLIFFLVLTLTG